MESPLDLAPERGSRGSRLVLAAALALGLDRFVLLESFGIWYDEALTWAAHQRLIDFDPWTYPLWHPAIRATVALAGGVPDELALRLLPAVMGFLGIVATWWAFRPFAGPRVAAGAALVLAASPWHLYLSQNARPYTAALTLSIVGAGLVLRGAVGARNLTLACGLGVSAAAALFHPMAFLGVVGLAVVAWSHRRHRLEWSPARLALLVALLLGGAAAVAWSQEELDFALLREQPNPLHLVLTLGFHVGPLVLAGCAAGTVLVLRAKPAFGRFALQTAVVMIAAALSLSLFVRITARYVLWALPWLAALACLPFGASESAREGSARAPRGDGLRWAYLALLVLPQLPLSGLYFFAWNGNRPHWREAYALVDELREPGDVVLGHADLVGWYYLGAPGPERTAAVLTLQDWKRALAEDVPPGGRAWFVLRRAELEDWPAGRPEELRELLRTECRLIESFVLVPTMGRDLTLDVYVHSG